MLIDPGLSQIQWRCQRRCQQGQTMPRGSGIVCLPLVWICILRSITAVLWPRHARWQLGYRLPKRWASNVPGLEGQGEQLRLLCESACSYTRI